MTHLLIWGKTRELLVGDLPAGLRADEVRSLDGLKSVLDGRSARVMVLADPRFVEAEQAATAAWLRDGGSDKAVIVAVADPADGDEVLRRLPVVDSLLLRPITPLRLRRKLERTIEALGNKSAIGQLERAYSRRGEELSELNKIGVALTAERDIDRLLELILSKCRDITRADAGSLYLVERAQESGDGNGDRLRFKLAQNDSVAVGFEEFTIPLDETSIAGHVALSGAPVNVPDAYYLPDGTPYRISRSFDEKSGYRTKSMLVVPMRDHHNLVIGVVQLINKKKDPATVLQAASLVDEQVVSFTTVDRNLVESLASQAAVAFENADLIQRMRKLFETFVHAAVAAIEQRDPTTSGHSERVAILTVGLIERVDAIGFGPLANLHFTPDQVEEVRYAALLHDFGKVAVQEKFLRKGKKLYASQMIAIRQRFAYILRTIEADYLRARLAALESGLKGDALEGVEAEYQRRRGDAERVLQAVLKANEPSVVEEESFRAVMSLPQRNFPSFEDQEKFPVEEWAEGPYLSTEEVEVLSIRKGSLSEAERRKIESHVSHTYEFLQKLPWTGELRHIPEIAWAHHEKLDGSGYPRGLKAPDIRPQSRMMTIADIYDALVAWDRPYKRAVSEERARAILCEEAQAGKIDGELLRVFLETEIYRLQDFTKLLQRRA
jgi:HD-GYP domain-containing protein (c-di-GMP phosphodiesterase class II)